MKINLNEKTKSIDSADQVNSFEKELFYVYLFKNFRFQHNIRPDVFHYYTTQEKIT